MSKSIGSAAILFTAFALSVACAPSGGGDGSAIQQLHADYVTAYNAGDADAIMELWSGDAVWTIIGEGDVAGAAEIRARYDNPLFGTATLTIEPEEVLAELDWGTAWGDWMLTWTGDDGSEMTLPGTYAAWYQPDETGKWRMTRLMTSGVTPPVVPQTYPSSATADVIFENDEVIVQKIVFAPGGWVGEHPHAGNQLVIPLEASSVTYRENGVEREEKLAKHQVKWVETTQGHDHKENSGGAFLLVTIK